MSLDTEALLNNARKAKEDGPAAVLDVLSGLIAAQAGNRDAAAGLVRILGQDVLPPDRTAQLFDDIFTAHEEDSGLIATMGGYMESARDIDDLNAAPPEAPIFARMLPRLAQIQLAASDASEESRAAEALASTARLMARQKDDLSDRTYARLVEMNPDDPRAHYLRGLFLKTRGRFAEGAAANRRAIDLSEPATDSMLWNLGICATGAGDAETALRVWRGMGNKLEIGATGLPEGSYPSCKVRLAQRPLAERSADTDDPGLEETIWIQRLSPCHGIVRSVLFHTDVGTDYGDTVLFDGAPIAFHLHGERQVPVFPHLATLARGHFNFYDFSATQGEGDAVNAANDRLDADLYVYSHTSSVSHLCATCWRDATVQHEGHQTEEHKVIHGRIAAHPDIEPAEVLTRIDAAYHGLPGARLFSPDLCDAASLPDRAQMERRRFGILRGN